MYLPKVVSHTLDWRGEAEHRLGGGHRVSGLSPRCVIGQTRSVFGGGSTVLLSSDDPLPSPSTKERGAGDGGGSSP